MATKRARVQSYTNKYLDMVIDRLKLPSDYALAEVLDVSTQAIYKLRAGGVMGTTTAAKIADILELDVLRVIAETELERGSDHEFWTKIRDAAAIAGAAIGAAVLYQVLGGFDISVSAFALALPMGNATVIHIAYQLT